MGKQVQIRGKQIIRPDDVPAYKPGLHAKTENRRLLKTEHLEILLGEITKGGAAKEHTHETTDQIMFILEGLGSSMIDGKIVDIEPGTLLYIPKGVPHGGDVPLNRTNKLLKFLLIYSPPLKSFP